MKDLNRLTLLGNVSKAPEAIKQTAAGDTYVTFKLCTSHTYKKNDQELKEKLEIDVFAWNGLAKWIMEHVKKGNRLYVEGRLKTAPALWMGESPKIEVVAEQIIPGGQYGEAPKGENQTEPSRKAPELSEDGDKF